MAQRDGSESVAREQAGALVSRARPLADVDVSPGTALRAFDAPRIALSAPDDGAVVGCGAVAELAADGPDRFAAVRRAATDLFDGADCTPDAPPRLLGGFAFHDDHEPTPPWTGFPDAYFVLPRIQFARDADGDAWLTVAARGPDADPDALDEALDEAVGRLRTASRTTSPPPGIQRTERTPSRAAWSEQVRRVTRRIADGDLEKVVLAQALTAHLREPFRLSDAFDRLDGAYDDCYRFAVDPGVGAAFFGATPERLVRLRGTDLQTEALAGSVARGATPEEDARLAAHLRESAKDQHEHRLVVDAIRERLTEVGADVAVADQRMRRLDSVQHLNTPISATLPEAHHVLDLVELLHPTPAVGGLPPSAAWRTIKETESFDRGWYAAPVGWFDAAGDGTFAVGIRSAVAGDDRATLFAGNGIVADSDPDGEWDEVQLKYRPILDHLR